MLHILCCEKFTERKLDLTCDHLILILYNYNNINSYMFNKQLLIVATLCFSSAFTQLTQPVFVDTDWLDRMIQVRQEVDLKIVDCSVRGDDNIVNFH
jgi:hypothetical protein